MTNQRISQFSKLSERWTTTCEVSVPPVKPQRLDSSESIGTSDGNSDVPPRYPMRSSNADTSSTSLECDESIHDDKCYNNKKMKVRHLKLIQPKYVSQYDRIIGMEIMLFVN